MTFTNQQKKWVFLIFFLGLFILAIYMLKSYIGAVIVGGLFTYFLFPIFKKVQKKVKSKRLAQIILSVGSVIILLALITGLIIPLIQQTQGFYSGSEKYVSNFIEKVEECHEDSLECKAAVQVRGILGGDDFAERSKEFVQKASSFLLSKISVLISSIASFILFIVIMVFSIFYFLDKGDSIRDSIVEFIPLDHNHKTRIIERLEQTIKAVVGGNISTALLQGVAGGIIFFILGISAPLFWGLLMVLMAFIPIIGPGLIWIPAAIILIVKGSLVKGIILIAFCLAVLGPIDNFLKPKLIGDKIKMSSFIIFLGVIGGLHVFGILGLFLGPIILALLVTCGQIYKEMSE